MKSISKPRDTQNARDEKENELNKKVEQFFNDVKTKLEYYDNTTLKEFEKMVNDLKAGNTRPEFRLDLFEVVTKFYVYDEAKKEITGIFCELLANLVDSKNLVKPISVLRYENYLKGLELIEMTINTEPDEIYYTYDCTRATDPRVAEFKTAFSTFKKKANAFFKVSTYPETKKEYEIITSKQRINDNFNEQMYKIAELYQLPISEKTYKRTLSNEITKYFIPNTKDEELNEK
ncbi:hypothetical protein CUREO4125_04750 [Campylobacter ureolyticus]|uniref:hypothetical protein n=1 Tax=Campylobacter ureolyticus TaxID=827 RepID=UPI00215A7C1E|nr:hypothetical protein [Campylobacter ureolyticus]MCR8699681.1 hypothetical protein [Campylobacter ureolyticus]